MDFDRRIARRETGERAAWLEDPPDLIHEIDNRIAQRLRPLAVIRFRNVLEEIPAQNGVRNFVLERDRLKSEPTTQIRLCTFGRQINPHIAVLAKAASEVDLHRFATAPDLFY